jgi:hypothetical protein
MLILRYILSLSLIYLRLTSNLYIGFRDETFYQIFYVSSLSLLGLMAAYVSPLLRTSIATLLLTELDLITRLFFLPVVIVLTRSGNAQ